jgi:hypothetical protein
LRAAVDRHECLLAAARDGRSVVFDKALDAAGLSLRAPFIRL